MTKVAVSADGVKHNFPDETPDAVISKVMKDYAAKQPAPDSSATTIADAQSQKPSNPFMGMSLDDLKKAYNHHRFIGTDQSTLNNISDAYVAKEQQGGGYGLALDDTIRQIANGIPVVGGALDEANAYLSSLTGGNYNEALDYQRARDRYAQNTAPVLTTGLNLAGGVAGTIAGARALGLGGMGVNSAAPLVQRVATGGIVGAPLGAADAFTRGEGGVENRATNAAIGAGIGTVTGLAAPLLGQALSSGYQNVVNYLKPSASFIGTGVSPKVGQEIVTQLGYDAGNPGLARIRAAGPDAMIADAGPRASALADAVITKGGPASSHMVSAIESRARAAGKKLTDTLNKFLGAPEGTVSQITNLRVGSAADREAAYNAAYAHPVDYAAPSGQKIESLFQRIPGEAWGYAKKLMQVEGVSSKQIMFDVAPDGSVTFKKMPDVRTLDYVKRALDAVAEEADGKGRLGGQTAMGRAFRNLSTELRNTLADNVKPYNEALQSAADPISKIEGIKLGAKMLQPDFTRAQLTEAMDGMTGPEREAVASGLRAHLDELVANVRATASDPNVDARQLNEMVRSLTSKAAREKIGMVLGDPKKTMQFFREVGQSLKSAELRASVATNSKTIPRKEIITGIDEQFKPGVIGTAAEGDLPGASKKAIQIATGATPRQQRALNNAQWLELAKVMSQKRGRDAEALLRKLITATNSRAATSATGGQLGRLGAGAVAGASPVLNGKLN